jgi:hypothetical protein
VTKGVPKKLQQAEQRRKRAAAAAGLAKGANAPHRYPVTRSSIGKRQEAKP